MLVQLSKSEHLEEKLIETELYNIQVCVVYSPFKNVFMITG